MVSVFEINVRTGLTCRIVYTQDVASELRARLEGKHKKVESNEEGADHAEAQVTNQSERDEMAGFKPSAFKSSFKPAAPVAEPVTTDRETDDLDDLDGEDMDNGDVDGEELGDGIDGVEDADGAPMDDLDGEEMGDVDGQPLADDLDGEAI
jgi:U2-associated protein SR140